MKFKSLVSLAVVLVTVAVSNAYVLEDITISQWAGNGNDTAYVVVDFDLSVSGDEYFFGYKFDAAQNVKGIDMLDALVNETTFEYGYDQWGMIGRIAYDDQDISSQWVTGGIQSYWAYYSSTDGKTWAYSGSGASDRILADGDWDTWEYTVFSTPEPLTVAFLGLGGFFLRKRK